MHKEAGHSRERGSPSLLGLCPRVSLVRVTEGMEGWRRRGLAQSLGHNRFAGTAGQASK